MAFNGVLAGEAVAHALETLGPDTNVVGHSLGGALLLDVASTRPVGNMVLFSPAPTPIQTIMARRTLLLEGQFDLGRIRSFASQVEAAAEGGVVEVHDLAWTGHTGALMKPRVIRMVAEWLGGDAAGIRLSTRLVLLLLMLTSSTALGIALLNGVHKITPGVASVPFTNVLTVSYAGAAAAAVAVLAFVPVTRWLHLFATDYLIGFLFVTGAILSLGRIELASSLVRFHRSCRCRLCHRYPGTVRIVRVRADDFSGWQVVAVSSDLCLGSASLSGRRGSDSPCSATMERPVCTDPHASGFLGDHCYSDPAVES